MCERIDQVHNWSFVLHKSMVGACIQISVHLRESVSSILLLISNNVINMRDKAYFGERTCKENFQVVEKYVRPE